MPKLYLRVLTDAVPLADPEDVLDGFQIKLQWLIAENDGSVRGHGTTDQRGLQDVADPNVEWLREPSNTVVFIPSKFVLKVGCDVPGRSVVQIRRALPFAVEEFVASDIESMHIAHAPIKSGETVRCNLVAREQLENWIASFEAVGINAGYFIADAELLQAGKKLACLVFDGDEVLVTHDDQAAVIDRGNLGFALAGLEVDEVVSVGDVPTDLELGQMPVAAVVENVELGSAGFIAYLGQQFSNRADFINILQGEYRPVRGDSQKGSRMRGLFALAAAWVVIGFLGLVIRGYWAQSQADVLEEDSFAFYNELFPKESQPVTVNQLRRRMTSKLGGKTSAGETSAFVGLTAQVANALQGQGSVMSLSYTEQRRELNVEVMLNGYEDIDTLKQKLSTQGVQLENTTAQQVEQGVRSQMRVRFENE